MRRSSTRRLAVLVTSGLLLSGCAVAFAVDDEAVLSAVESTAETLTPEETAAAEPTRAPEPAPDPVEVREDVSPERPAALLVAHLVPAAPDSTLPGLKVDVDGSRWQVVSRTDARVVRVATTRKGAQTLVKVRFGGASAPRFAQVSRTAGHDHGTLGLLTLDGRLLRTMKAPQPLTNGFLELPAFSERGTALDFVNRVTKSRP